MFLCPGSPTCSHHWAPSPSAFRLHRAQGCAHRRGVRAPCPPIKILPCVPGAAQRGTPRPAIRRRPDMGWKAHATWHGLSCPWVWGGPCAPRAAQRVTLRPPMCRPSSALRSPPFPPVKSLPCVPWAVLRPSCFPRWFLGPRSGSGRLVSCFLGVRAPWPCDQIRLLRLLRFFAANPPPPAERPAHLADLPSAVRPPPSSVQPPPFRAGSRGCAAQASITSTNVASSGRHGTMPCPRPSARTAAGKQRDARLPLQRQNLAAQRRRLNALGPVRPGPTTAAVARHRVEHPGRRTIAPFAEHRFFRC